MKTKSIKFSCYAPDAKAVFVAGTFNDWSPDATPLQRGADGEWKTTLQLPSGHQEFKFVVDGRWCCDPDDEDECPGYMQCCTNEFGTMNRVLEVA